MESVQQLREKKQQYLCQEIINKDYDPQEFTDYCLEVKGNVDIDEWTFTNLVELVCGFVSSKKLAETNQPTSNFDDPFDFPSQKKNTTSSDFSGFGVSGDVNSAGSQNKDFNFEFIQDSKPMSLNAMDLDFLSGAFLPQNNVPESAKKIQGSINQLSGLEGKPVKQFHGPTTQQPKPVQPNPPQNKQTMKVPQDVANQLVNQSVQSKLVISTQQPVSPVQSSVQVPFATIAATKPQNDKSPTDPPASPPKSENKKSEDFQDKIPCRKVVTRSLLINSKAEMFITGHQIVTTNMFVPDHVVYHLNTTPINIEVKRRFKDFQTLRNILRKLYPINKLPHLEKNSRLSQTEPQVIKRQKYFLQCFINDLLISPEYQNCRIIEQFLTLKDLDHLKKKFKEYQKVDKVKCLEQLNSISGQISINFSQANLDYNDKVDNFIEVSEAYYQKIRQLYDQMLSNLQLCIKTLTQLSQVFVALQGVTKTFNSSVTIAQFPQLQRTYKYIASLNNQWSTSLKAQAKLVEGDLRGRFKFQKQNMLTMREVLKFRNNITESYLKRAEKERNSLGEKYSSSKLDDYKTGIEQPSKNFTVLLYQNGYINDKTSVETQRMFTELAQKLQKEFCRFSKVQESIHGDMKEIWAGLSRGCG